MVLPIFRSRRLWASFLGLLFMVLVQVVPGLAEHADTLQNAALILIGLLIGGFSLEDAVLAYTKPEATAAKLSK